jgi:fatty-acid peroxygenase
VSPSVVRDESLSLLREGYAFLPARRRRAGSDVVALRLLGRPVVAGCGPRWTQEFYDERLFQRSNAIPGFVLDTLFGHGGVQTLDDATHRHRKRLFLEAARPEAVRQLATDAAERWDLAAAKWARTEATVLFDECAEVLTAAACGWVGIPPLGRRLRTTAADLVAMVDGFATLGARHVRARVARRRQERWLGSLVDEVRTGKTRPNPGSALAIVAAHRDGDGLLIKIIF